MTNRMQSSNDLPSFLILHEKILKKKVTYPRPYKIFHIRQAWWIDHSYKPWHWGS